MYWATDFELLAAVAAHLRSADSESPAAAVVALWAVWAFVACSSCRAFVG